MTLNRARRVLAGAGCVAGGVGAAGLVAAAAWVHPVAGSVALGAGLCALGSLLARGDARDDNEQGAAMAAPGDAARSRSGQVRSPGRVQRTRVLREAPAPDRTGAVPSGAADPAHAR